MIANSTRLTLLWLLFERDLCVEESAVQSGISPHHASTLLSSMAAKGLIIAERHNRRVVYRPHLHGPQDQLLTALKKEKNLKTSYADIIAQATAFTHERRIQIARTLSAATRTFEELRNLTGLTSQAQTRHLRKLLRRGVVEKNGELYRLQKPSSSLAKHLLSMAVR
jgi:DNA-binding MarR family transcriptional regulator